ncbi:hypothetical protein DP939_02610 [Spongiactinospora rosea]|uniref:Uncharacterized protein n=1 Tax=Spongiactinospora rosea TaxID=2248750 RepID=A0A366M5W8_9ACTN|nr:hypothetical protein [Spongiactinospora rosea]RBQ21621.1 hypothetical protein DP939_02610 [Spongiactinospora rosea]
MALSVRALVQLAADLTSAQDLTTASAPLSLARQVTLTDGAGLNQANRIWSDQRTLAASASEDIDLAGTLTDPFGATITLARVKALIVSAAVGNVNNVVLGNAAANGWVGPFGAAEHTLAVRPGGVLALLAPDATGYAVTAGTADLLHVANSGAGSGVTYQIVVVGAAS